MADVSKIIEDVQKEVNQFLTSSLGVEEHGDIKQIPLGIDYLDLLLGGGIGESTFTVAVGYSGSFKSTIAIEVAKAFKRYNELSPIIYIDTESAMTQHRLTSIGLPNIKPITGFTVEKVLATIDALGAWKETKIKEDPKFKDVPILVIWDSIANTPVEAELADGSTDVNKFIGLKARILSGNLPKTIEKMRKYKIALYAINQFRDKVSIGLFQSPSELKHMQHDKTMPGGSSIMFNAAQMLEFRTVEHKTAEESKYGFRHAKVEIKTVKNKFFPDGYKCRVIIDVARGVDNLYTNFELLSEHKRMTVGAWNYLKSYPDKKFRTKDLRTVYQTDEAFRNAFDSEVKSLIQELKAKMSNFQSIENHVETSSSDQDTPPIEVT